MAKRKQTPKQLANLKRFGKEKPPSSREEAERNGKKGGEKSQEVQAEKKENKKIFEPLAKMFLNLPAPAKHIDKIKDEFPDIPAEITNALMEIIKLHVRALTGDAKAFESMRDIVGERPVQETKLTGGIQAIKVTDLDLATAGLSDVPQNTQTD